MFSLLCYSDVYVHCMLSFMFSCVLCLLDVFLLTFNLSEIDKGSYCNVMICKLFLSLDVI